MKYFFNPDRVCDVSQKDVTLISIALKTASKKIVLRQLNVLTGSFHPTTPTHNLLLSLIPFFPPDLTSCFSFDIFSTLASQNENQTRNLELWSRCAHRASMYISNLSVKEKKCDTLK